MKNNDWQGSEQINRLPLKPRDPRAQGWKRTDYESCFLSSTQAPWSKCMYMQTHTHSINIFLMLHGEITLSKIKRPMINNETYNTRVNLFSIPRPSRSQQEPISLVSKEISRVHSKRHTNRSWWYEKSQPYLYKEEFKLKLWDTGLWR